jgi:hypothetical protein
VLTVTLEAVSIDVPDTNLDCVKRIMENQVDNRRFTRFEPAASTAWATTSVAL